MSLLRREWPLLLVLAVLAVALTLVAQDHFKRGTVLFGLGVCLAALLRATLPDDAAGVLRVRSRALDVATLAGFGMATLLLALAVPPPS